MNDHWTNDWIDAGAVPTAEAAGGQPRDLNGVAVAVFFQAGQSHVVEAYCPGCGRGLSEGTVADRVLRCRCAVAFQLDDGEALEGTPAERLHVYPTMTVDDRLYVHVPSRDASEH